MNPALYDSFIADYYDESPVVSERLQDVAFYREAVREFGDPVLELGCGTGRIMMALADAGKRITGLDLSERMLERAVKKRAALNKEARERVHLVQGDMARFDLGETFRLVIIPFRPFQHLLEVQQQVLKWPEGNNDQPKCFAQIEPRHVSLNEVNAFTRFFVERRALFHRALQHALGKIKPGDPLSRIRQRHHDAPRAATQLQYGIAELAHGFAIERDVLQPLAH